MNSFIESTPGWLAYLSIYGILLLRYFLVAGLAFWICYQLLAGSSFQQRRIQLRFPQLSDYKREIGYSALSLLIFAGVGWLIFWLTGQGYTQLYQEVDQYGWRWFGMSILVMILIHDTWFYWIHRLMHLPRIFPWVHKVHHLSHNPSPWAAFAFHPLEALLEVSILPLIAFCLPVHRLALFLFFLWMIVFNVMGHLGYELFPKGFVRHPLGRWANTSTHHNLHHRAFRHNFGLYFNFWDRIMGTNHPRYEEIFDQLHEREPDSP